MYEQIVMLLSFVFAIAMTHLLSTATELVLARDRVIFSGLMALWMVIALLILLINWLSVYSLSTVRHWTPADILLNFVQAAVQYFTCSLLTMRVPEHGLVDMPEFFQRQRRVLMLAFAGLCVLAMIGNYLYIAPGFPASIWIETDALILAAQLPLALAAFARRPWLQWLSGLLLLALSLIFLALYTVPG